jgi:hypothetical protein
MTNRTDKFPPGLCRIPEKVRMKRKKLAQPFSKTKKVAGRVYKKWRPAVRPLRPCDSAGQPTENLATGPERVSPHPHNRGPTRRPGLHAASGAPGFHRPIRDNSRRGRVGAVAQLLSTG